MKVDVDPPPNGFELVGAEVFLESAPPKLNTPLGAGGL